jgi:hypothetical protein
MIKDRFLRVCMAMIVAMLGVMMYERNMDFVRAASPSDYMVEGNSGQDATRLNAHMKARVAEGWTLHTFGTSFLVWQK